MVTINKIQETVREIATKYPIKKVSLFRSHANGTATNDSDVDLLVEFLSPAVSLFTLYNKKNEIEDKLKKKVDLIHAPMEEDSLTVIEKAVVIYER